MQQAQTRILDLTHLAAQVAEAVGVVASILWLPIAVETGAAITLPMPQGGRLVWQVRPLGFCSPAQAAAAATLGTHQVLMGAMVATVAVAEVAEELVSALGLLAMAVSGARDPFA